MGFNLRFNVDETESQSIRECAEWSRQLHPRAPRRRLPHEHVS